MVQAVTRPVGKVDMEPNPTAHIPEMTSCEPHEDGQEGDQVCALVRGDCKCQSARPVVCSVQPQAGVNLLERRDLTCHVEMGRAKVALNVQAVECQRSWDGVWGIAQGVELGPRRRRLYAEI